MDILVYAAISFAISFGDVTAPEGREKSQIVCTSRRQAKGDRVLSLDVHTAYETMQPWKDLEELAMPLEAFLPHNPSSSVSSVAGVQVALRNIVERQ